MNQFNFHGRIVKDPELKKLESGVHVCQFSLAIDRPGTNKENRITDFFDCEVWGKNDGTPGRAGVVAQYFHKGDGMIGNGVMTTRKYTDKDGKNRTAYTVRVNDFEFPIAKRGDAQTEQASAPAEPAKSDAIPQFTKVDTKDLPF